MKKRKEIDKLNLSDNFMFASVMSDGTICRMFLEKLLGIEIEEIKIAEYEKTILTRKDAKDIRVDVYVRDNSGKVYDIEMQSRSEKVRYDLARRTRYYQSAIDTEELNKGEHYSELPESYIIFVCTFDEFGLGKSLYTFRTRCDEVPELVLQNGAKVIILNTKGRENAEEVDSEIAAFLRYLESSDAETAAAGGSELVACVHKRFELVKKEERDAHMTLEEYIEDERYDAMYRGREEGKEQAKLETAQKMKAAGFADDIISEMTDIPKRTVADL